MAENKTLSAVKRTGDFGSAGSRRLTRNGQIPAVIYGKMEPEHIILSAKEFNYKKNSFSESTLIALSVEGEAAPHRVFVKTYQEDLLKGIVKHVDFYEVTAGHVVRTHVRVELEGTPEACKAGAVLDQVIHEIEIECLPKDLPEVIKADVSALAVNEAFRIDQIVLPEGIKVIGDPEATVASVKYVKEEPAPAADDTAAAPAADAAAAAPADAKSTN